MSYRPFPGLTHCIVVVQWEALDDREKDRLGYERQLKRFMDGMMDDLRRKIQRNEQRLAQNEIPVLVSSEQVRRCPPRPCCPAAHRAPRCHTAAASIIQSSEAPPHRLLRLRPALAM